MICEYCFAYNHGRQYFHHGSSGCLTLHPVVKLPLRVISQNGSFNYRNASQNGSLATEKFLNVNQRSLMVWYVMIYDGMYAGIMMYVTLCMSVYVTVCMSR